MEVREGIWVSKRFHYRDRINNQQQLFLVNVVNLHYKDAPLKINCTVDIYFGFQDLECNQHFQLLL